MRHRPQRGVCNDSIIVELCGILLKTAHLAVFEWCPRAGGLRENVAGRLKVKVSPMSERLTSLSLVFGIARRKK